jgi:hypothetical protein
MASVSNAFGVLGEQKDASAISSIAESEGDIFRSFNGSSSSSCSGMMTVSDAETEVSLINGTVRHASTCSPCHGGNLKDVEESTQRVITVQGRDDDEDGAFTVSDGNRGKGKVTDRKRKISAAVSPVDSEQKRSRPGATGDNQEALAANHSNHGKANKASKALYTSTPIKESEAAKPSKPASPGNKAIINGLAQVNKSGSNATAAAEAGQNRMDLVVFIKGVGCNIAKHASNNPIIFSRDLSKIVGQVTDVKVTRDCLRVTCDHSQQVTTLLQTTDISGKTVKVTKPWSKTTGADRRETNKRQAKGIIFGVSLKLSDEDIFCAVNSAGVQRMRKWVNGVKQPTTTVILTFDGSVLPKTVKIGYLTFKVKPYIPPVIVCKVCLMIGHNKCDARQRCVRCSRPHRFEDCPVKDKPQEAHCARCNGNHSAAYRGCVKYKEVSKALSKVVKEGITFKDALLNVKRAERVQVPRQPPKNDAVQESTVTAAAALAAAPVTAVPAGALPPKEQRPPNNRRRRGYNPGLETRRVAQQAAGSVGSTTAAAAASINARSSAPAAQPSRGGGTRSTTAADRVNTMAAAVTVTPATPAAAAPPATGPSTEQQQQRRNTQQPTTTTNQDNTVTDGPPGSKPLDPCSLAASLSLLLHSITQIVESLRKSKEAWAKEVSHELDCLQNRVMHECGTHEGNHCLHMDCCSRRTQQSADHQLSNQA